MPKAVYGSKVLGCYEFGRQLVETKDLDPVYVILWEANFSQAEARRFLLAYWNFYYLGTAAWIVDQPDYWVAMMQAASSKEWPRSSERRHFRGRQATETVEWQQVEGLDSMFDGFPDPAIAAQVMQYVGTWKRYGPWATFKVADMMERLGLLTVDFSADDLQLYDSPRKGARDLWNKVGLFSDDDEPADVVGWALGKLAENLGHLPAPPRFERTLNVQEYETCLCKWHSYLSGKYHVGEDIEACRKGLGRFDTPTAKRLLKAATKGGV